MDFKSARSFTTSIAETVAVTNRPGVVATLISEQSLMTWAIVKIDPSFVTKNPVPELIPFEPGAAGGVGEASCGCDPKPPELDGGIV